MKKLSKEMWILLITLYFVLVGFGIIIPIMPYFAKSLGGSSFEMGLLTFVWAIGQFLMAPKWGNLADRYGRRKILLIGVSGYAFVFIAMAQAQSMLALIIIRALGGLISAATLPSAQAYAADITTKEKRSETMALMGAAMNLGFITGPALGAVLAPLGVAFTFYFAAALVGLNALAAFFFLPETVRKESSLENKREIKTVEAIGLALRGPEALFFILAFVGTFGGASLFSMLGFYLIDKFNASEIQTGIAFTLEGLTAVVVQGLGVAFAVKMFGEEKTLISALTIGIMGFIVLAIAPSYLVALIAVMIIAAGISLMQPLLNGIVSTRTNLPQGVTMGTMSSFQSLGRAMGPLWAGLVYFAHISAPFISSAILYGIFVVVCWYAFNGLLARKIAERTTVQEQLD